MKRILFLGLIVLMSMGSKAQGLNPWSSSNDEGLTAKMLENFRMSIIATRSDFSIESLKKDFDGSPFLVDSWQKGTINMKNGEKVNYEDMVFNLYNNQFWVRKEDGIKSLVFNPDVAYCELDGKKFVFKPYQQNDKIKDGLQELLAEGKLSLMKLYYCKFIPGEKMTSAYQAPAKPRFAVNKDFYYQDGDSVALPLPSGKDLFAIFGDAQGKMASYAKENKLKLKKEEDLVKLFTYYNSL